VGRRKRGGRRRKVNIDFEWRQEVARENKDATGFISSLRWERRVKFEESENWLEKTKFHARGSQTTFALQRNKNNASCLFLSNGRRKEKTLGRSSHEIIIIKSKRLVSE